MIKLRQFGELLAKQAAAKTAIYVSPQDTNVEVLANLTDRGILTAEAARLFHGLRKAGNAAVHQHTGTQREALHQLRMARSLALWFQRFLGKDPRFKAGPFVPPPDPQEAERELLEELERLRQQLTDQQHEISGLPKHRQTPSERSGKTVISWCIGTQMDCLPIFTQHGTRTSQA